MSTLCSSLLLRTSFTSPVSTIILAMVAFAGTVLNLLSFATPLKAIIVLSCGVLFAASVAPTQPRVKSSIRVYKGQPFEYVVRIITHMALTAVSAAFLCFFATIVLSNAPTSARTLAPYVCPAGAHTFRAITGYSLRFVMGAALVALGALLRLWAKHTLGSLFTYEVAILKGHTLIVTGPYALVRHPGYTGMITVIAGVQLMQFGQGGYATTCGIARSPAGFLLYLWYILAVFVVVSLSWRTRAEDAALSKHFGPTWDRYRAHVPYALLPLVL